MNLFRELTHNEEREFRQWARDNYEIEGPISCLWHPVVQDECHKMNNEAKVTEIYDEIFND